MSILSAMLLLFLVLDPMGNIPIFLACLKNVDQDRHRRIIVRESLIGLTVLLVFLFGGRYILMLLNVSQSSLGIAGGIILFLIAVKMVFSSTEEIFSDHLQGEPYIVPLAIPLIAGPSAMTTVILLMAREPERWMEWFVALLCAWFVSCVILIYSRKLSRILGDRGLIAMERLMGLILTTVAVEMLITGIRQSFFHSGANLIP